MRSATLYVAVATCAQWHAVGFALFDDQHDLEPVEVRGAFLGSGGYDGPEAALVGATWGLQRAYIAHAEHVTVWTDCPVTRTVLNTRCVEGLADALTVALDRLTVEAKALPPGLVEVHAITAACQAGHDRRPQLDEQCGFYIPAYGHGHDIVRPLPWKLQKVEAAHAV